MWKKVAYFFDWTLGSAQHVGFCLKRTMTRLERLDLAPFFEFLMRTRAETVILKSPGIDSKEKITPACVGWRVSTTNLFLLAFFS